jgi:LEA14-like dessication related protein
MRAKGDKYRPIVTINKLKNGTPTVITVSGHQYTLQHPDQYRRAKN